ncbi:hypothetical protein AMEX_G20843 [Astyanax mexicanus]|uniref:Myb-like domain-containing protein n=1 Tax=Astyanax mexicanus TaxID=7994 RepID=A0A8T2L5J4_ASTMX|nr:hypothetical protein AMEX_G20843 [Astyanax mexicanus]
MIRRSRISVRPNVKPSVRVPAVSRDASQDNPPAAPADPPSEAGVKIGVEEVQPAPSAPAVESNNNPDPQSDSVQPQPDITPPAGDDAAQSTTAGSVPASGPQRRKRFTVLPNLARPRTSPAPAPTRTSSRTPRSPVKAPVINPEPAEPAAPDPPPQDKTTSDSRGKRRPSGGGRQPKAQPKPEPPIQISSEPSREPPEKDLGAVEKNEPSATNQNAGFSYPEEKIQSELAATSEIPAQAHEVQLISLEKETPVEEQGDCVSPENDQSSLQTGGTQSQSIAHVPLALRTINDPMDRARLAKARKLRELLRKEMNKDKQKEKHPRPKMWVKTCKTAKDHTKMTMRELIYYLPSTNPMKSYAEDEQKVTETVLPSSPKPAPPAPPAVPVATVEDGGEEEEETACSATGEEEPLLAPRVKVAEDGSLIIDEESLTVEVLRVKGPNPAEDRDPIFERGSTTTYSSFRKGTYTKPWSNKETDMFFLAISMVGTDFSMIGQLFPHRARIEIKNKFKKEERANSWRIDKAFKERRRLDLEFFNNLLEKILQDEEKKRKKKKDGAKLPKASGSTQRKSAVRRKRGQSSAGSEEEESSGSDVMEGEKENEGVSNDGGSSTTPTISPKRKKAKKKKQMNKAAGMAIAEDAENLIAEGPSPVDRLQDPDLEVENCAGSDIKPAQLKGRVRRPAPNLLRRWRNPSVQKKDQDTSAEEESGKTKLPKKSTSDVGSGGLEDSEEEEEPDLTAVQEHILNKPTRSGRIPKLSQHVMRAVADEDEEEVEQQSSSAPPPETRGPNVSTRRTRKKRGPSLKQGMPRRGKSRLVTLRASAAEEEEDDEEDYDTTQDEEQYLSDAEEEENQAFVPMGLRTHPQVHTEVEETVEELDMCVNVPDVLGISQNAVCPESSCARSLGPGGTVPCEHQLDLLVDVIEFLAPEPMEVSEESSTEAARTLLTIGHSAHLIPAVETSGEDDDDDDDDDNLIIIEDPSMFPQHEVQQEVILETTEHILETGEEENVQVVTSDLSVGVIAECRDDPESASIVVKDDPNQDAFRAGVTEASEADCGAVEESVCSQGAESNTKTSEQTAPQTRRNRLPRPKPNLGRASRPLKEQLKQRQRQDSPGTDALDASVKTTTTTEDQLDESKPSIEASAESQKALDDSPAVFMKTEAKNPQLSLEKKHKDEGSEVKVCEEEENEEKKQQRLQLQQPNSSESASAVIESSVQPSQPSRRCRGPKPKPNLVRSSRITHPHTQKTPAQPAAVPTEESATVNSSTATISDPQKSEEANISQHQIQKMEVCSNIGPEEYSGPVSKQDSLETSERKKTAHITDDDDDDDDDDVQIVSVEAFAPMAEVFSEESVFILSLTEVPPTAAEKQDLTQSESLSETLRAADCIAGDPASCPGPSNMFAPISEDEEEEEEEEEEKEMDVENENKGIEDGGLRQINKREYSLLNQKNPVEESPAEQHGDQSLGCKDAVSEEVTHPAKRPKLPERGRRAKLQIKPNPVQRKGLRNQPATIGDLPVPASEEASSAPASSQRTSSRSEDPVLLSTSVKDSSSSSSTSHSPIERTKASNTAPTDSALPPDPSLFTPELISLPSAQSASVEAPPTTTVPHAEPHTSSKDSVKQENLSETPVGAEDSEPSGSGVDPQPVHQITPLASTGPLTRPGRRPRGFLSFMSSTSTQGPSSASRGSAAGPQKPAINTSRSERRRAAPGPLTSTSRSASTSQKSSRLNPSPTVTPAPDPEVNAEPETHKPDTKNPSTEDEEEPTSVSAYFFSDIFTMVDEQEEME